MSMSQTRRYDELAGADKAAVLLMALPAEASAAVLRHLPDEKVERVTIKMLQAEAVASEAQESVLQEAHTIAAAQQYIAAGGIEYARRLLTQALGPERAEAILERLIATLESQHFHFLADVEPGQIATFLHNEHPQTIALILSYLGAHQTAAVLSHLPEKLRPQVSMRLASMDAINPAVVEQVETALKKKLATVLSSNADRNKTGGLDYLVKVLTQVDRSTERAILDELDASAPDLATDIKKRMFIFENLMLLDNRAVQRVLRDVDSKDLALAMRGATQGVKEHVFNNMSQRAAQTLREELETSPPVRLRAVEEAQQKVVAVVRQLEEAEEITIARGSGDVML